MNNRGTSNSLISVTNSNDVTHRDVAVSTESCYRLSDGQVSPRSTYESFISILFYIKMFLKRLLCDLLTTLLGYIFCNQILPAHIMELMNIQRSLRSNRESQTITLRRYNLIKSKCSVSFHQRSNQTISSLPETARPISPTFG